MALQLQIFVSVQGAVSNGRHIKRTVISLSARTLYSRSRLCVGSAYGFCASNWHTYETFRYYRVSEVVFKFACGLTLKYQVF